MKTKNEKPKTENKDECCCVFWVLVTAMDLPVTVPVKFLNNPTDMI